MRITEKCFVALALIVAGPVAGADIETLKAECDSCHGPNGNSAYSDVPIIAGQTPEFLSKSLRSFQRWDRPCIKSEYRSGNNAGKRSDMCQVAGKLGDEDITALAKHYSAQTFIPARQEFDATLAGEGAALHEQFCQQCHENGGKTAGRGPRLSGQWTDYLSATLKYVPTGEHLVPPKMERTVADIPSEDIERLMNFYASQQD